MWDDIFDVIFIKHNIPADINSKYHISFPNGSKIHLLGLDATPRQKAKLRGQKFDLAVIDEIQDFRQDLTEIIEGVLSLTLAQTKATLLLGGTPGNAIGEHYWWQLNKPDSPLTEWKLYRFDWHDNTTIEPKTHERICDTLQAEYDKKVASNPLILETPTFQREWLGQWVILENIMVYKYDSLRNDLPPKDQILIEIMRSTDRNWIFTMGVDFGWTDDTAIAILAWHKHNPNAYIVHSEKHASWTLTQVAEQIKFLQKTYRCSHIVGDSSARQSIEELARHHSIPIVPSERAAKFGYIQLLNADFITGNLIIDPLHNKDLISELKNLTFDEQELKLGRMKEDAQKQNHLTDAMLYAYRNSRHYRAKPKPKEIDTNSVYDQLKSRGYLQQKPQLQLPRSHFDKPNYEQLIRNWKAKPHH